MKFHQGIAGLLTLLVPFAAAVADCDHIENEWGRDLTPCEELEDDGNRRDRALEQIQHLPTDRRQLVTQDRFSNEEICDGQQRSIDRTVACGGDDVIELELVAGTTYTIDVQRDDCELMDPTSFLFQPGLSSVPQRVGNRVDENTIGDRTANPIGFLARSDDSGIANLPVFCDQTSNRYRSDPLIKFEAYESGDFKLLTGSQILRGDVPECPLTSESDGPLILNYRVFISCTDCGNNNIEGGEECDEGNNNNGDTCTATCRNPLSVSELPPGSEQFRTPAFDGGANGDPHFKTWHGKHFDFHGVCDLVLLQNKEFESGLGLDVHIRTHMRRDMSYISSVALRMGADVLEVESQGVYYLNGVAGADLPSELSGFQFLHTQPTAKQHVFDIHLGGRERIKIKTYKDFVSVSFEQGQGKHFAKSAGLMGDFEMGHMVARDGKTIIDDANAFGQEWQVLDTEYSLFQTVRFPQHPSVCTMPTPVQASQLRRRLSEKSNEAELAAVKACEHWGEGKDDCVFDVLATGDLEMAVGGAY
jgi:cysteine-rich repeat protein